MPLVNPSTTQDPAIKVCEDPAKLAKLEETKEQIKKYVANVLNELKGKNLNPEQQFDAIVEKITNLLIAPHKIFIDVLDNYNEKNDKAPVNKNVSDEEYNERLKELLINFYEMAQINASKNTTSLDFKRAFIGPNTSNHSQIIQRDPFCSETVYFILNSVISCFKAELEKLAIEQPELKGKIDLYSSKTEQEFRGLLLVLAELFEEEITDEINGINHSNSNREEDGNIPPSPSNAELLAKLKAIINATKEQLDEKNKRKGASLYEEVMEMQQRPTVYLRSPIFYPPSINSTSLPQITSAGGVGALGIATLGIGAALVAVGFSIFKLVKQRSSTEQPGQGTRAEVEAGAKPPQPWAKTCV